MRHTHIVTVGFFAVFVALTSTHVGGQAGRAARVAGEVPRTPDNHPDFQGVWNAGTITPLERPAQFADKPTLTEQEAAAYEKDFFENNSLDRRERDRDRATGAAGVGGYNEFWVDRGTQLVRIDRKARTSIIIDPPDGHIPAMTEKAQQRDAARGGLASRPDIVERQNLDEKANLYDDPEQRPLAERCLMGFGSTSGPPALPVLYNNFKQIVQTADRVMILNEMAHEVRTIRIGGQHLPSSIRLWTGDSVARWEGDTLVVDTTNFTAKTRFRGSDMNLHVTERFSRAGPDTLLYRFTVEDSSTWIKPWTGEYLWAATSDPVYEYACHEGNYALPHILTGHRQDEAEKQPTKSSTQR